MKKILMLFFIFAIPAQANDLTLDGMSVHGNQELPKALFIVPWKNPAAAMAPRMDMQRLSRSALAPVDPEVFQRQLQYFELTHSLPE